MSAAESTTALPTHLEQPLNQQLQTLSQNQHNAAALLARQSLPRALRAPLFFNLGHIAKADGRVTESDIRYAEALIKALSLSSRQRRQAIARFQRGKAAQRLPLQLWARFRARLNPQAAITTAICLCHGAQVTGLPGKARRYRCEDSIVRLGLPVAVADEVFEHYASRKWAASQPKDRPTTFEQACRALGVTRRDSLADIKRVYRKKVSECHPDKLAQQKLTPSERAMAKDRLLIYQQAWELIKKRHSRRT